LKLRLKNPQSLAAVLLPPNPTPQLKRPRMGMLPSRAHAADAP